MEQFRVQPIDVEYYKRNIPCQNACPAHTDARGYVQAIARGDYQEGYAIARQPNPFASSCGRVCVAPCETACRRGKIDAPIPIRALKRFLTQRYGVEGQYSFPLHARAGEDNAWTWESHAALVRARNGRRSRIAIIGSGPAGLSAAHDLALLGYQSTVFEALGQPGGSPRIAIPNYRLPRSLTQAEVKAILQLGIELRLYTPVEGEAAVKRLKSQGFEAIFIATGVEKKIRPAEPEQGIFTEEGMGLEAHGIIHAVAAGHHTAMAIDRYLRGQGVSIQTRGWLTPVDQEQFYNIDYLRLARQEPSLASFSSGQELEIGYIEEMAVAQARRCLNCHIQTVFVGEKCVLCGGCVDVCPQKCLKLVPLADIEINERVREQITATYGSENLRFLTGAAAMLKDETKCIRCGMCAKRCPTQAVTLMAFNFEESWGGGG